MTCEADNLLEVNPDGRLIIGEGPVSQEVDLFSFCAEMWRGNEDVDSGDQIRPIPPNGFAAQCIAGGTTGSIEPRWPKVLDAEIADGSARWKMIAGGSNGINVASSPAAVVIPSTGLAVDNLAILESRKITADYTPTVAGTYTVVYSFTVKGETRKARHRVIVKDPEVDE